MLGGKHLHVNTHFRGLPRSCICPHVSAEFGASGDSSHEDCLALCKTFNKSRSGASAKSRTINVNLLLACRQIHREAALIPFTKNTFMFGTAAASLTFIRELLARQRAAITTVVIFEPHWALDTYCSTSRGLFPKLIGLKRVNINLGVLFLHGAPAQPSVHSLGMRLEEVRKALHGRSLAQVIIGVEAVGRYGTEDDAQKRLEPYQQLARETETAILASQGKGS